MTDCPVCGRPYTERTEVEGLGETLEVPTSSAICVEPVRRGTSPVAVVYEHDKIEIELTTAGVAHP